MPHLREEGRRLSGPAPRPAVPDPHTTRPLRAAARLAALAALLAAAPAAGTLMALPGFVAPALAADSGKGTLKDVGEGFKKLGKKVGAAGKEAGLEIAEGAKRIWYKGKKVSAPLLRDVQRSTRAFWSKVVDGKDRTIEKLRDENEELKERLEDGGEDE